jgi:YfiH family protein
VNPHPDWLRPTWSVDAAVGAFMTTRHGGVSAAPFDSLNLRDGVGDDALAVTHNQRVVAEAAGAAPVWLDQVHGATVVRLTRADAEPGAPVHRADAAATTERGIACAVQVADCLPVLFAAPGGRAVGAAHAGWRGLAAGVLEATLAEVSQLAQCAPDEVQAWLGACIGPAQFEVGVDVLDAFRAAQGEGALRRFVAKGGDKWLADLPGLARDRLQAAGVRQIGGESWCTVSRPSRFFSFRRDRVTGRMAALIWINRRVV